MSVRKFKLNFLFLCDDAFVGEGNKLSIIGIFKNIGLGRIPGVYLKCVLVGGFTVSNRAARSLDIDVRLIGPDGQLVGAPIPPFSLPPAGEKTAAGDVNFTLELGNLKFEKEGDYKFEVKVDSEFLGEYKFQVRRR